MRITDTLSLSMRMFRTRPLRTLLTILGVGVGIGTVLFLVSIGYGLQKSILERIATADMLLTLDVRAGSESSPLTEESAVSLQSIQGVDSIARFQELTSQVTFNALVSDLPISAIDPISFKMSGIEASKGSLFSSDTENKIILTSGSIPLFGVETENMIGSTIIVSISNPGENNTITTTTGAFIVAGIVQNDQESRAYIPLHSFHITNEKYDLIKVKVHAQGLLEEVRNTMISQGFIVSSISDIIDQANSIFYYSQIILGLFGFVAIVVSAIGMFNTMTITLLERTNEIGIMRAIGITSSDICKIFLLESMLMGLLGGILGICIGTITGEILNILINMLASHFNGPPVDIFDSPRWFVVFVLISSAMIGLITGIYPSIRASRLNPLDALRYK